MMPASKQLAIFVRGELENLGRVLTLAERRMQAARIHPDEADAYIESAALNLQSFYTASEQILARIARTVDESVPAGGTWHTDLLRQMTYDVPGRRPPVLRPATHDLLDELRGFRHRVRNVYTFHLNPDRVQALVSDLPGTFAALSEDLEAFARLLDALPDDV